MVLSDQYSSTSVLILLEVPSNTVGSSCWFFERSENTQKVEPGVGLVARRMILVQTDLVIGLVPDRE